MYSVAGQRVRVLVSEHPAAGGHQVAWDGHDGNGITVGTGVYLAQLVVGDYRAVKRMVLTK